MGAFLVVDDVGFDASLCGAEHQSQCQEHKRFLYNTESFRGLITSPSGSRSETLRPFMDTSLGETTLSTTTFEMMPNFWSAKSDYLALWVTASDQNKYKVAVSGQRAVYSIIGAAHTLSGTSCAKRVGEIEIQGERYDVHKCERSTDSYTGATLDLSMPLRDGAAIDLTKEEALVVFRRTNFTHKGTIWSFGEVRVVKTRGRKG